MSRTDKSTPGARWLGVSSSCLRETHSRRACLRRVLSGSWCFLFIFLFSFLFCTRHLREDGPYVFNNTVSMSTTAHRVPILWLRVRKSPTSITAQSIHQCRAVTAGEKNYWDKLEWNTMNAIRTPFCSKNARQKHQKFKNMRVLWYTRDRSETHQPSVSHTVSEGHYFKLKCNITTVLKKIIKSRKKVQKIVSILTVITALEREI